MLATRWMATRRRTEAFRQCVRNAMAQGEDGQALVELAVSLPVLLLVVSGILTFGIAISNYLVLTNATSSGGRQLAISRGQNVDPCATAVSTIYAAAPTLKQSGLTFSFVVNGATYSGVSCGSSSVASGAGQGTSAQITVSYPCSLGMFGVNYAPGCMLQAQANDLIQ